MVYWMSSDPTKQLSKGLPQSPLATNLPWQIAGVNTSAIGSQFWWLQQKTPTIQPKISTPVAQSTVATQTQGLQSKPQQPQAKTSSFVGWWWATKWSWGWDWTNTTTKTVPQNITVEQWPPKLSVDDFANKIKEKYPMYSHIDNTELAQKIVEKHPEYKDKVEVIQPKWFLSRLGEWIKGMAQQISKAWEGWVDLLDKLLWTEDLNNAIQYSYDKYGMSPKDLMEKKPTEYKQYKQEIAAGWADQYKTTVSEDVLNVAQWTLAAAQTAAAPWLMAWFTVAWATNPWWAVLEKVSQVFGWAGNLINNMIPWLSDFKESLPEDKRAEFDMFVGNVAWSLLLGTRGKANIIKNPRQFVIDNIGSQQIIDNFKQNVIGITEPIKKWATIATKAVKEKLTPWINLDEASIKKAQENPYVAEHLNKIHADTDGNMSEVPKTYKDMAVKEVWDTYIKPELDAKIETYKEWGSLYQNIRATKQNIDVNGLDVEAKAIANKVAKSELTPTDQRNIANALAKVDDIIADSKEGKFDTNVGLNTRQSFDNMIEWAWASSIGNNVVKDIRRALDDRLKTQVAWLKETDALASKKIQELEEFKKQLINKEWNINYANLKNVNSIAKTDLANRLDEFVPWATDRIEAINQAVEIAKKTKWFTWTGKLGAKGTATALWAMFGWPLWAVLWLLLEPLVEGTINKKLSYMNQRKVIKMFEDMTPEAKLRLQDIWNKIKNNTELSSADKVIIEQARKKFTEWGIIREQQQATAKFKWEQEALTKPALPWGRATVVPEWWLPQTTAIWPLPLKKWWLLELPNKNGTTTSNSATAPISKGWEASKGKPEVKPTGKGLQEKITKPTTMVKPTAKNSDVMAKKWLTMNERIPELKATVKAPEGITITNKEPISVYRGEGKWIGNTTYVKWQYFADSKKFAETFGNVTEWKIPANSKIFNFDAIKSNPNQKIIPKDILIDPDATTQYLIDKWYTATKNTNTRWAEYVLLPVRESKAINFAKKFKTYDEFKSEVYKDKEISPIMSEVSMRINKGRPYWSPAYKDPRLEIWEQAQANSKWLKPKK